MNRISFAAMIFLLLSSLSFSSTTKPKDVYGWDNLRWGMSGQEVQSTLGKEVKKRVPKHDEKDNMYSGLELRDIDMGGAQMRASFWMGEDSNKLKRIVFIPHWQLKQYEGAKTFIDLENFLVAKYGDPDFEKTSNDPGTSAERQWKFPSTEIELSYLRLGETELLLLVFSHTDGSKE